MQVVEGQQSPAVVLEGVDGQQAKLVGPVAQLQGQGVLAAVHHAGIHEGGERIDLVSDGDVALRAGRAGAEEGDAVVLVLDAGVIGRDLRHRERDRACSPRAGTEGRSDSPLAILLKALIPLGSSLESRTEEREIDTPQQESLRPSGLLSLQAGLSEPARDHCLSFHQQSASELQGR